MRRIKKSLVLDCGFERFRSESVTNEVGVYAQVSCAARIYSHRGGIGKKPGVRGRRSALGGSGCRPNPVPPKYRRRRCGGSSGTWLRAREASALRGDHSEPGEARTARPLRPVVLSASYLRIEGAGTGGGRGELGRDLGRILHARRPFGQVGTCPPKEGCESLNRGRWLKVQSDETAAHQGGQSCTWSTRSRRVVVQ